MAFTAGEIAQAALSRVNSTANYMVATQWVSDRYAELIRKTRPKSRRRISELHLPAAVTTGTISVTQGSRTVTGNAAAIAAWQALSDDEPSITTRHLRAATVWYKIDQLQPDGTLVLQSPYTESTVTAGTYDIIARFLELPTDVRYLMPQMILMRLDRVIRNIAYDLMQFYHPRRVLLSNSGPEVWSDVSATANGTRTIELYPYTEDAETVAYGYYAAPPIMTPNESLPSTIDRDTLVDGVLIDVMRHKAAVALEPGGAGIEAAAFWRNESRAQESTWRKAIQSATMNERGVDDTTFILQLIGRNPRSGDIRTAYDEIYARGSRP